MESCNVCNSNHIELFFNSEETHILTSNNKRVDENSLKLYFCHNCSHCITHQQLDTQKFYAEEYKISLSSEDEDQLISINGSDTFFRTQFQAMLVDKFIDLSAHKTLLDYGGAKSTTIKKILEEHTHLEPHIYDVSNDYEPFWEGFYDADKRAIFSIPSSWHNKFDLVTSFFAFEHIGDISQTIKDIYNVLKDNGELFFIVPNVYSNPADFLVADHTNHFSQQSILKLLSLNGFKLTTCDSVTNPSWIIVLAKKSNHSTSITLETSLISENFKNLLKIASLWKNTRNNLQSILSAGKDSSGSIAIYGAGFYGSLIANLIGKENFNCFIDKNIYLQQQSHLGKDVFSPSKLPSNINSIIVGLNPAHAKKAINSIQEWKEKSLNIIYPF